MAFRQSQHSKRAGSKKQPPGRRRTTSIIRLIPPRWRWVALLIVGLGILLQPLLPEWTDNFLPSAPTHLHLKPVLAEPPLQAPQSTQPLLYLENIGYRVGYNLDTRLPAWVHYRLIWENRQKNEYARPRSFEPDPRVPVPLKTEFYTTSGLTKAGYQRGHLAPSSTIATYHGREAQLETFLLSNIVPQMGWHNERIWNSLERIEADDYTKRYGLIDVWCGPIFGDHVVQELPIPRALYKIIRRPDGRCLAFIIAQDCPEIPSQNLPAQITTIAEIERQTGLSFPDISEEIKTHREARLW